MLVHAYRAGILMLAVASGWVVSRLPVGQARLDEGGRVRWD